MNEIEHKNMNEIEKYINMNEIKYSVDRVNYKCRLLTNTITTNKENIGKLINNSRSLLDTYMQNRDTIIKESKILNFNISDELSTAINNLIQLYNDIKKNSTKINDQNPTTLHDFYSSLTYPTPPLTEYSSDDFNKDKSSLMQVPIERQHLIYKFINQFLYSSNTKNNEMIDWYISILQALKNNVTIDKIYNNKYKETCYCLIKICKSMELQQNNNNLCNYLKYGVQNSKGPITFYPVTLDILMIYMLFQFPKYNMYIYDILENGFNLYILQSCFTLIYMYENTNEKITLSSTLLDSSSDLQNPKQTIPSYFYNSYKIYKDIIIDKNDPSKQYITKELKLTKLNEITNNKDIFGIFKLALLPENLFNHDDYRVQLVYILSIHVSYQDLNIFKKKNDEYVNYWVDKIDINTITNNVLQLLIENDKLWPHLNKKRDNKLSRYTYTSSLPNELKFALYELINYIDENDKQTLQTEIKQNKDNIQEIIKEYFVKYKFLQNGECILLYNKIITQINDTNTSKDVLSLITDLSKGTTTV